MAGLGDARTEICAVFAHPDDEAFGVSGTIAAYAARDMRSALICATRGEAGLSNGLAGSPAALAALRSEELARAGKAMGLAELILLDFADGGAAGWDRQALADQLDAALHRLAPQIVITFDAGGVTRHPDHIAVHEVTRDLIVGGGLPGVHRLYYQVVTCPDDPGAEVASLACIPADTIDVAVDVREFETAKRAALGCHLSQAADTAQLLSLPMGSLAAEYYVLAWADDGWRPRLGETDLLAGL
ncbi:MAG TPA: PIG-L deacetylase family protein [Anaerolineae bacterium]